MKTQTKLTYAERLAKRIARRRAPVTPQGKAARAAAMARRREAWSIRDERATVRPDAWIDQALHANCESVLGMEMA